MAINITSVVGLLKEVELFSEFDHDILIEFANNMSEFSLKKGEILFNKGDKENALYIILTGSVEVHDEDYIFTTLNSKQFFGEYSLIDSAVRSATVTAFHDSHLLKLEQNTFDTLTKKRPEIWKNVLVALTKRLRDYNIIEEKLTMRTLDIQRKKNELEKEKENIAAQKKNLEAINNAKDKFLTILGHDLKDPFNTVMQISDLLLKKFDQIEKEDAIDYINQIHKHSKNASELFNNILLWARSQTGSLNINFKRTNVKIIIDSIVELFAVNAKQNSITLSSEVDKELYGYFDLDMITIVIRNLVLNALKFTNETGKINIRAVEVGDMVQIEVIDSGIGISKKDQEELFDIDRKFNVDESLDQKYHGLGMVLIKEFISKNGGDIWVESEINAGTVFKFTLPKAL